MYCTRWKILISSLIDWDDRLWNRMLTNDSGDGSPISNVKCQRPWETKVRTLNFISASCRVLNCKWTRRRRRWRKYRTRKECLCNPRFQHFWYHYHFKVSFSLFHYLSSPFLSIVIDKLYFQINKSKSTIGRLLIIECHFFLSVSLILFFILKEHFRIYMIQKYSFEL